MNHHDLSQPRPNTTTTIRAVSRKSESGGARPKSTPTVMSRRIVTPAIARQLSIDIAILITAIALALGLILGMRKKLPRTG